MGKREIQWTEAHRREALRRTYEIAAEMVASGENERARDLAADHEDAQTEEWWRGALLSAFFDDPARIDREVARVDALATGRLVRDTQWIVRDAGGDMVVSNEEHMRREARTAGHCVIRRRIRRRSP